MDKKRLELPLPAIDGPWRVDSYGARLIPARNGSGVEELRLIDHSSLAVYGSFESAHLREIAQSLLAQSLKQTGSILPVVFDRFGILGEHSAGTEETASDVLRSLISYGERYEELLRESRLIWSPNGKYLTTLVALSSDELSDGGIRESLGRLIELSKRTVVRPIVLAENPRRMAPELQDALSWQAFLGADRSVYARDRYSMAQLPGMRSREPIGVSVDAEAGESRTLNSFSYEPTGDARDRRQAIADDVASYERFLEGLTDGS